MLCMRFVTPSQYYNRCWTINPHIHDPNIIEKFKFLPAGMNLLKVNKNISKSVKYAQS